MHINNWLRDINELILDQMKCLYNNHLSHHSCLNTHQGNLIQGKAQLALKNWKNLFGDQREDSLTSLEVCYLL